MNMLIWPHPHVHPLADDNGLPSLLYTFATVCSNIGVLLPYMFEQKTDFSRKRTKISQGCMQAVMYSISISILLNNIRNALLSLGWPNHCCRLTQLDSLWVSSPHQPLPHLLSVSPLECRNCEQKQDKEKTENYILTSWPTCPLVLLMSPWLMVGTALDFVISSVVEPHWFLVKFVKQLFDKWDCRCGLPGNFDATLRCLQISKAHQEASSTD